jgi:hypothetical protein
VIIKGRAMNTSRTGTGDTSTSPGSTSGLDPYPSLLLPFNTDENKFFASPQMQFLDFLKEDDDRHSENERDICQHQVSSSEETPTLVSDQPIQYSLSELFSSPPSPSHYLPTFDYQKDSGLCMHQSQFASPFYSTLATKDLETGTVSWSSTLPSIREDSYSGLSIQMDLSSPEEENNSDPLWSLRHSLEDFQRQEAYSKASSESHVIPGESMISNHHSTPLYLNAQVDVKQFFQSGKPNLCTVLILFPKVAQKSYGNEKRWVFISF